MAGVKIGSERSHALQPEAWLRQALAAADVGLWSWDLAADVITADAVARRLWSLPGEGGIPAEQLWGVVHPEDVAATRAAAIAARATGDYHVAFRLREPDGAARWIRIRGRADKALGKGRIAGVTVDVTERKRVEAELTATEERLRRAQELGGAVPFEWDSRSDRVVAPRAFNALYGLGPDEAPTLASLAARVHASDRARFEANHRRLVAEPGPFEAEFRVVLPRGRVRWLLARGESIGEGEGMPTGIAGIAMDITTRKEIEQDLRRSKREARVRFREIKALYQNAPVGLALLDRALTFQRVNEALAEMNGRPVAALIGRNVFDIVPHAREAIEPLFRAVLETGQPRANIEIEGAAREPPKPPRSFVAQFYPVKDHAGATVGVGVVCQEVTEQKRAERARDLLSRELSHRIKNMFAVMSSIIRLSARGNEAVQTFAQTIRGRIEALGRAHDYVRPLDSEHGAALHPDRSLHSLINAILDPYREGEPGKRIHIGGDDTAIGPGAATAFALAIHEFATNAVKYGALATALGSLDLSCRVRGERFELTWIERGGPAVTAPAKEGFGMTLARRSVAGELGGTIVHQWAPEGLTIRLSAPLKRLAG